MIKNKLIGLGVLSAIAVSTVSAQEEWSVTSGLAYESSYVFRGVKLAEGALFPSVDVAYNNFYAGVWAALPTDTDENNEIDFYAGYGAELNAMTSLDVGFTFYTYPSQTDDFFTSGNTLEFYTGLAFDLAFSPALYVYYDIDLETLTFEASGGHSIEIAENTTFDVSAAAGYVHPDEGDEYLYGVLTAGFGYAISEAASISVYGSYSVASENYEFSDEPTGFNPEYSNRELWWGASISAGF